jgi:hypothetical protein
MGCALGVLALVTTRGNGIGWAAAHVGDVRILSRSPDGTVRLETRDHTPAFTRWEAGEIEIDEIADTPGANRLQRAVGRGGEPDATWLPARPGWAYLIISDGITKAMRLDELGAAIAAPSALAACELMRQKVEEREPDDNFTAVVVRIGGATHRDETATHELTPAAMNRPVPDAPPRTRVPWGVALLALLALATAGFALWTALEARGDAVTRTEIERLQAEIDSLRLEIRQIDEPFGPTEAETPEAIGDRR